MRSPRGASLLVCAFVAILALDHYRNHLAHTPGIDFYQYWAVPTARRASVEPLGTPYADSARYAAVLEGIAQRSTDARLQAVTEYHRVPDFASDPLLYVLGGWLPRDYSVALRLYQALQALAFGWAVLLLTRRARWPTPIACTFGLLMALYFMPVLSELRVLNTNMFQLCALALAASLLPPRPRGPNVARAAAGLCLTTFVVFLKPLWIPLPVLALAYVVRHHGAAIATRAGASAAGLAALLLAWPAAVFGPGVWSDWYREVFGAQPDRLLYDVEEGNRSATLMLANASGQGVAGATVAIGLLLSATLLVAILVRGGAQRRWRRAARRLADDVLARPESALGFGILMMVALSPLVWWHYLTLTLVPTILLLSTGNRWLAGLSFLLASGRLGPIYAWLGDAELLTIWGVGFAWLPLWLALVARRDSQSSSELARRPDVARSLD